jgi:hypothetical protein
MDCKNSIYYSIILLDISIENKLTNNCVNKILLIVLLILV